MPFRSELDPRELFALGSQIGGLFSGRAKREAMEEQRARALDIERQELVLKGLKNQQRLQELELEAAPFRLSRERTQAAQADEDRARTHGIQDVGIQERLRQGALQQASALVGAPGGAFSIPGLQGGPTGQAPVPFHQVQVPGVNVPEQLGGGGLPGFELMVPTEANAQQAARQAAAEEVQRKLFEFAQKERIEGLFRPSKRSIFQQGGRFFLGDPEEGSVKPVADFGTTTRPGRNEATEQEQKLARSIVNEILDSMAAEAQGRGPRKYLEDLRVTAKIRHLIENDPTVAPSVFAKRPDEDLDNASLLIGSRGLR